MDEQEPKLAIFVALDEEYEILKRRWTLVRDFAEHRARGRINSVPVDVISANGMGRVPAAVTTGYYLAHRRSGMPLLILVVGLAGGFQEEGIEEGMVIVSDRVIDLATRKVRDKKAGTQTEFRRRDFPLDGTIHDFVTSTDFDQAAWQREAIEVGEWPSSRRPSLHFGSLTSLDEVVSSTKLRKEILNDTPKLLGVEMEAAGVCAAADRYKVPVAMIRAISDKSDPSKKDNAWRSRGIKTIAILIEMLDLAAITSRLESNK
jgi:nucleoside phosphorylase